MSLKTVKKRQVHDYDSIMKGVKRTIQIELSENNSQLINKYDMENLVYEIMQRHSDEAGKETNYSYDHKKILKIFMRCLRRGSREFAEVGDPPETAQIRMRRVQIKPRKAC